MSSREASRLEALRSYRVLDTPAEAAYDTLAKLAASICGTPIALVSLIDASRQWFKANVGLEDVSETPRAIAFCDHAIRGRDIFEVPDAAHDERFAANPLVVDSPALRFYAGAPLVTTGGDAIGTICVIDRRPRALSPLQREQLALLGRMVMQELEYRAGMLRLADGLSSVARFTEAVLAAPQPDIAVRALVEAAAETVRGSAALMRRTADGTYGSVGRLDERPLPGGRAALLAPFRLENAPPNELALPVPGAEPAEWVVIARGADGMPVGAERSALVLMVSAFATALRNIALHGEAERRRGVVARLARDVRGPVTSIVGYAGLLSGDDGLPAETRRQLEVIRGAGERIGALAADVERLSRGEPA
jgi:hypothetical protein